MAARAREWGPGGVEGAGERQGRRRNGSFAVPRRLRDQSLKTAAARGAAPSLHYRAGKGGRCRFICPSREENERAR